MPLEHGEHDDPARAHAVDDAMGPNKNFAHVGLCLFGHDATRQRKSCGSLGLRDEPTDPTFRRDGLGRRDVVFDLTDPPVCLLHTTHSSFHVPAPPITRPDDPTES